MFKWVGAVDRGSLRGEHVPLAVPSLFLAISNSSVDKVDGLVVDVTEPWWSNVRLVELVASASVNVQYKTPLGTQLPLQYVANH